MTLRTRLQLAYDRASEDLLARRSTLLAESGMPSGLAYLSLMLLNVIAAHDDDDEISDLLRELVGVEQRKLLRQILKGNLRESLCTLDGDESLLAACQALVQALSNPTTHTGDLRTMMQITTGAQSTVINPTINAPAGDLHLYQAAPNEAELQRIRAVATYLQRVMTECNALPLDLLDASDGASQPMQLGQVYINLFVERQVELTGEELAALPERERRNRERPTRPVAAWEALGGRAGARIAGAPVRLMLLGKPGGGKSTFVSHLAFNLAQVELGRSRPTSGAPFEFPGWQLGACLPIRVILRDLAAYQPLASAAHGTFHLLLSFLTELLTAAGCVEALGALQDALTNGRALLLFDGLDEVIGDVLPRVTEATLDTLRSCPQCPAIVTCRVLDYEQERLRQLPGFARETLADLSDDQIQHFVGAWYDEYAASGRRSYAQASRASTELQQALAQRPELRDLGRTPLLLTVMALVHASKGTLPTAAALLYHECILLLLLRWRQGRDGQGLIQKLGLRDFGEADLFWLMARIGFRAHDAAAQRRTDAAGPADLAATDLLGWLAEEFAGRDEPRKHELAATLLRIISSGNGLLLKRGLDTYTFPHRTFQEFLAGFSLRRSSNYRARCLRLTPLPHWHEAIKLMVGYQVLSNERQIEQPLDLALVLLERSPAEQVLAGELFNLIGPERAISDDREPAEVLELWRRARDTLLRLATKGSLPDAPIALRARAGFEAGRICYGEPAAPPSPLRPPDPRLLDPQTGNAPDGQYWCAIAPGPFWFGDDLEGTLEQVTIDQPYQIARFPITNAEYARFLADDGYNPDATWWQTAPQGRTFLLPGGRRYGDQEQFITQPRYWHDPEDNQPTQPVAAISWYEAAAYGRWLTIQGYQFGWLPITHEIRLPTALEWERAARHTDKRPFPWGQTEPTPEFANYAATKIGSASPVGCFPAGRAVCGAEELAGNVREWLATPSQKDAQVPPIHDPSADEQLLCTYSWFGIDQEEQTFFDIRYRDVPNYGYFNLGFRVVWSLCSSVSV